MRLDHLAEIMRRYAVQSREASQVAGRLHDLLPVVLQSVKRKQSERGSKAERRALVDDEYLRKIDEYVEILRQAYEAKIQFETHRMLLEAKKSLDAYHRQLSRLQGRVTIRPRL